MKVSAKITVALCPILFWSTLAYEFTFTSGDTVSALHVSGNSILDSNNNIVYLRGVSDVQEISNLRLACGLVQAMMLPLGIKNGTI